jgi:hypothetical protein
VTFGVRVAPNAEHTTVNHVMSTIVTVYLMYRIEASITARVASMIATTVRNVTNTMRKAVIGVQRIVMITVIALSMTILTVQTLSSTVPTRKNACTLVLR